MSQPSLMFLLHVTLAHLQDFGVWNISYESVSCVSHWSGSKDAAALGSVPSLADGACCPADPTVNHKEPTCLSHPFLLHCREAPTTHVLHFQIRAGYRTSTVHFTFRYSTGKPSPNTASSSSAPARQIEVAWVAALLIPIVYSLHSVSV